MENQKALTIGAVGGLALATLGYLAFKVGQGSQDSEKEKLAPEVQISHNLSESDQAKKGLEIVKA